MTGLKNTHRRLMRVGQMLKLFLERERVTTATLSREFHTTARTIQRDLSFLKQCGFPVTEAGPGSPCLAARSKKDSGGISRTGRGHQAGARARQKICHFR